VTRVGAYMTASPLTIGVEQSLAVARRLMSEHHVRHLPVLHGGDPVGVLSDREVESFEALPGSGRLTVEEAMVADVYVTSEQEPLDSVAAEMARLRVGSAVVVASEEHGRVLGVFTAVDALRALADVLRSPPAAAG
jgi:acetoin utilization protein AcuB